MAQLHLSPPSSGRGKEGCLGAGRDAGGGTTTAAAEGGSGSGGRGGGGSGRPRGVCDGGARRGGGRGDW